MGNCGSSGEENLSAEEAEKRKKEKDRNRELERKLDMDNEQDRMIHKLLLLGAGESGKSTLFKQMITIYGQGFTEYERKNTYLRVIHSNTLASIKMLSQMSPQYGPVNSSVEESKRVVDELKGDEEITPPLAQHIAALWRDKGIQETYSKRHLYQLTDSTQYFLDKVLDIAQESYVPTEQDVLRCRVRTTGIVSNEFVIEGNKFQMFDVGGQRNERKKWIHCFENVTAVLFVAAISEYDQMLYEDETVNRVEEALTLFDEIANSRWFKKTAIMLFLNKRDIFAEKITRVPLTVCFKEYDGPQTYDAAVEYMQKEFEKRNRQMDKPDVAKKIYTHVTCATDTNNVKFVFNAVKDVIIKVSLEAAGLV